MGLYHYRSVRDYEQATSEFETALELRPNYAEVFQYLGAMHKRQGNFEEAVSYTRRAERLDPRRTHFKLETSINLKALGRFEEADKALGEAIRLAPDDWSLRTFQADFHLEWRGDLATYTAILEAMPSDHPLYQQVRATVAYFSRDYSTYLDAQSILLPNRDAKPSTYGRIVLNMAWAHFLQGDADAQRREAKGALPVVVELAENDPSYHSQLSEILALLGRREEALAAVASATKAVENEIFARGDGPRFLMNVHILLGDFDNAVEELDNWLAAFPNHTPAFVEAAPHFDSLRERADFQAVLEKHRQ
jgi:tetratricopeptide (TPR) repeat protein